MKLKIICISFFLSIPAFDYAMGSIFIKPTTDFPKTRFANPGLTSFEVQYARATVKEAYNETSDRVPALSFHGPEDLLKRFLDKSLPYNDTATVGQALFDGIIKLHEFGFNFTKNFENNIFFAVETTVTNIEASNIKLYPVSPKGRYLTSQEINADAELKEFIEKFQKNILEEGARTFEEKSVGPSAITIGYAKSYDDFKHIDFINYSVQGGLWLKPLNLLVENFEEEKPFDEINNSRQNLGIPIQANIEIGTLNWFNIGACGLVVPFISSDNMVRLNPTATNNIFFSNDIVLSKVHHHPFIYFNTYFQAEELLPKLTLLAGISYEKQFRTVYEPHDTQRYPCDIINEHSLHKPWQRLTVTFEAELDLAKEEKRVMPRIKFIYAHPFWGKSVYKGSTGAGLFGLEIHTEF